MAVYFDHRTNVYRDDYGNSYDQDGRYMNSAEYENAKLNSMMAMQQQAMMMQSGGSGGSGQLHSYGPVRNQYAGQSGQPVTPAGPDTRLLLLEDTP